MDFDLVVGLAEKMVHIFEPGFGFDEYLEETENLKVTIWEELVDVL